MEKQQRTINNLKDKTKTYINSLLSYLYDFFYFWHYSNIGAKGKERDQKLSSIITNYHIIEKGLAMPNRRYGFGEVALLSLIDKCNQWLNQYDDTEPQVKYAISVVAEYNKLHKENGCTLSKQLQDSINALLGKVNVAPSSQKKYTRDEYFANSNDSFSFFSKSRHSIRWYEGAASKSDLLSSIALAQNTPSSCNKQSTRIHVVLNEELAQTILNLQQGNRGFGHLIKNVLVVTSDLNYCSRYQERHSPYIDSGMYAMNLLYCLHYHKIGAIPLVWLSTKKRDKELHGLLNMSKNEVPSLIIGVGKVADEFYQVSSPRRDYKETTVIHE